MMVTGVAVLGVWPGDVQRMYWQSEERPPVMKYCRADAQEVQSHE